MVAQPPQNGTPKKPPRWRRAYLAALRISGVVLKAAEAANVHRRTVYRHRDADSDFAAAWDEAVADAADRLEAEAVRRAKDGWEEPVIYQGEPMGVWVDAEGKRVAEGTPGARFEPLTVRKYSDTLLIFLLKGAKPGKFRERHELTGADGAP